MTELEKNLNTLQAACANPKGQLERYISEGRKVVGCFPPYTPEELVYATGMIPMGMWGGQTEVKLAKSYLPAFACPIMQADMELGLTGAYQGLSAVIIPAICDTLRCMTQNWRFGVKEIPMIPIVYPQNRTSPASVDYLISEYETVLVMLATITGNQMKERELVRAIQVYNEHNAAMRAFSAVANRHLDIITPKVRHAVNKSAFFFDKAEHTRLVRDITAQLEQLPDYSFQGQRVVLTGIVCEPDALLDIFEELNIAVVGDDLAQEGRQWRTDTPETGGGGLRRLALQWNARQGCSLIHELGKPRGEMLVQMCRQTGAQGVVNCMMKFCDPEEYDQPFLVQDLHRAGLACVSIDVDTLNAGYEQIRTRLQTLCEML